MNIQIAALVNMEMLTIHFVSHETFVILKKVERKAKIFLFFWEKCGDFWEGGGFVLKSPENSK